MKNFSKKLSFVMATAMVVTSLYTPQEASAATKNAVVVKGSTKAVKSKNIYLTGKTVDFDAIIKGKKVKDSAGKWTSSSKKVATVDKNGVVKVVGAGTATIKFTDKKSKKTASVKVYGRVRAAKMMLTPAAVTVKEGATADVTAEYELSKKVQEAGAKTTTYKLFAESSDESVATVTAEGTKVTVKGVKQSATPVSITVYAAQVSNLAKAKEVKIKLTEKFDVKVAGSLEAKQSGANKITVMGTDLVASKSAYVLTNANGVKVDLKDAVVDNKTIKDTVVVNADKTEATLEGNTLQLPVGKYKLSYNGGEAVEFEVVKAVVKNIQLSPSNTAIMSPDGRGAYVLYTVYNQFGEDVTKLPIAANIKVTGSDNADNTKKGVITFRPANSATANTNSEIYTNPYQLNVSKLSVSVVDVETGANASAILTVGDKSRVWEPEFKGIYNMVTRKYVESISDDSKLDDYKLLFKVKDQYGHDISDDETTRKELMVTLLSITGVTTENETTQKGTKVKIFDMGNEDYYYAYSLKNTSIDAKRNYDYEAPSREGEVTIQAVAINNGKTISPKFNVAASDKVDSLVVRAGALGVYEKQGNWLDFTALDVNGKEVTSWDKLKVLNDVRYLKNFRRGAKGEYSLYFVKRDNGKVGLYYYPQNVNINDDIITSPQILTFVTPTNKFSTATLNVRAQRRPVSIVGLVSDAPRGVTHRGKTLELKAKHIRFQDQFGNVILPQEFDNRGYKVAVSLVQQGEKKSFDWMGANPMVPAVTGVAIAAITSKDSEIVKVDADTSLDKTGSSVLKLTLVRDDDERLKKTSDTKSFEVYNVLLNDMSRFEIKDPGLKPAAELDGPINGYNRTTAQFEFEVRKPESTYFMPEVIGYYAGEPIKLASGDYKAWGLNDNTEIPYINENVLTKRKATTKVTISDDKPTEVTREFEYSNERRRFAKADIENTEIDLQKNSLATWTDLRDAAKIVLKDQYGDVISNVTPIVTIADYDKDVITFKQGSHNGNTESTIEFKSKAVAGDKTVFTLKLNAPGSNFTWEKVITVNIK